MVSLLRGIFFDLDDTLIGYNEAVERALVVACEKPAVLYPELSARRFGATLLRAYETRYGYGTAGFTELATLPVVDLWRQLTRDALESLGITDTHLAEQMLSRYADTEHSAMHAFPEMQETLTRLRPHFALGVITNGPSRMQRGKIADHIFNIEFDVVVIDTEFGIPKPDPRIFAHAARSLGFAPDELLFVGNSLEDDMAGAKAAGWHSVWINRTGEPLPTGFPPPDHTINRLSDLLQIAPVRSAMQAGAFRSALAR